MSDIDWAPPLVGEWCEYCGTRRDSDGKCWSSTCDESFFVHLSESLERERDKARAEAELLRDVEWHWQRNNHAPSCPWCGEYKPTHEAGCELHAALAGEPEKEEDGE